MHAVLSVQSLPDDLPLAPYPDSAVVIEADSQVRRTVTELLERFCPAVAAPTNGLRAFDLLTDRLPAVVVLGTPLPDLDAAMFARIALALGRGATRVITLAEEPEPAGPSATSDPSEPAQGSDNS